MVDFREPIAQQCVDIPTSSNYVGFPEMLRRWMYPRHGMIQIILLYVFVVCTIFGPIARAFARRPELFNRTPSLMSL